MTEIQSIHITWVCTTCRFPIADGEGCINIPFVDLSRHKPGREVVWRVQHDKCLPTASVYGIDVEKVRDDRGLLRWTHHLMSKNWFADSTWDGIIGSVVWPEVTDG